MNISLTGEADLVFGGVDIDIHVIRGHIDENDGHRKLPLDQSLGVAFKQGMLDDPVAHKPTVDVNIYPPGSST